jgi:hypothetical protein
MGKFWITGWEAVQAVQLPDNSIPMIGDKTTFVRVYMKSDSDVEVTGYLTMQNSMGTYVHILPMNSSSTTGNRSVNVTTSGSDRKVLFDCLMFKLEGDFTTPGSHEVSIFVYPVVDNPPPLPPPLPNEHFRIFSLGFSRRLDLNVYGVVWECTDSSDSPTYNTVSPAAPWSDFEDHRRFVENVFPVASFTIEEIPGIGKAAPSPQPFTNFTGSQKWAEAKLSDLPRQSIINLLDNWNSPGLHGEAIHNPGDPPGSYVTDERNERTDERMGNTMAQELAHAMGLDWHTFSPGTPFPDAILGNEAMSPDEIGIILTGPTPDIVHNRYDIMSYRVPPPTNWVSSFTYLELIKGITARGPFESLGGKCDNVISAVSWGPNRLDVFVRGQDETSIFHKSWDFDHWDPDDFEMLGFEENDGQLSAASWGTNRLDIFVRSNADKNIYHRYWDGGIEWKPYDHWENLGQRSDGQIAAVSWGPNRLDLFVRGAGGDSSVYHKAWAWDEWERDGKWENLQGRSDGYISAVSWGPNRLDVFIRSLDGDIMWRYWDGRTWNPSNEWENISQNLKSDGQISAVSWGPNRLDVFVRKISDRNLYHRYWDGVKWNDDGWINLQGGIEPDFCAVSWGPNRLDVFVRSNVDKNIYHKYLNGTTWGTSLYGYQYLGGEGLGKISAVSWAPNRLDVFSLSTSRSLIYKKFSGHMWGNSMDRL